MPVKPAGKSRPARKKPHSGGKNFESSALEYDIGTPNEYIGFFESYGMTLQAKRTELHGNCPFPSCPNPTGHFYASSSDGRWVCHRCQKSGNIWTFMRQLHAAYLALMTKEDYAWLREMRPGITTAMFKKYGVVRFGPSSVGVPSYNMEWTASKIVSFPLWRELSKNGGVYRQFMNPRLIKSGLFGLQFLNPRKRKPLYICEGQWDLMAWDGVCTKYIMKSGIPFSETIDMIAVCGSGGFPRRNISLLNGRDVYLLFDNDDAGLAGVERLRHVISETGTVPLSLHRLTWADDLPSGYDIRDLISEGVKG